MSVTDFLSGADRALARTFLEAQGLAFEPPFEDLVGIFEDGALVAVGARAGDVLKMLAVDPARQGGAHFGQLVTELARRGVAAGHDALFAFTKPAHVPSFEALGELDLLVFGHGTPRALEFEDEVVALIEYRDGSIIDAVRRIQS